MKRFILLCLLFCVLASSALADGNSRALLLGCDSFLTLEDTTPSSANNVRLMSDILDQSTLAFRRIVLCDTGVGSRAELEQLLRMTAEDSDDGDTIWFYLSTHGLWDGQNPGFLLSNGVREEILTARELREMLDSIPGGKVLVLDTCHSGAVIGKGLGTDAVNYFQGQEYLVICSGGGAENSWFWSGEDGTGAGYFSGSLALALGGRGGWAADINRDGRITLYELSVTLPRLYGESTPHFYPEADQTVLLTYDVTSLNGGGNAVITGLEFGDVLSGDEPSVDFSFTLHRPGQIGYRLIYRDEGIWNFDEAEMLWDSSEGSEEGWLTAGWKERSLTFTRDDTLEGGYVLIQMIIVTDGTAQVLASHTLCVEPVSVDQTLEVSAGSSFVPSDGEELPVLIIHSQPCTLTVSVEDSEGLIIRRLTVRKASRAEGLVPDATTLSWDGLTDSGKPAAPGLYRILVLSYTGDVTLSASSAAVELLSPESGTTPPESYENGAIRPEDVYTSCVAITQ